MPPWIRKALSNKTIFFTLNAIFWLGLGAFLLSDETRAVIGGALLALLLGAYILYSGFTQKLFQGNAYPGLLRSLCISLGLIISILGLSGIGIIISGGVPTPKMIANTRVEEALEYNAASLNLSGLGLRNLPAEIQQLHELRYLNLSDNRLKDFPTEIAQFSKLEILDLSHNRLESLPVTIKNLANLESLRLNNNRLSLIPPELGQLIHLSNLDLASNRLINIPLEIGSLQELEVLHLSYNQLSELPTQIGALQSLRILSLQNNALQTLPTEVVQLQNLKAINLSDNPLDGIPGGLSQRAESGELTLYNQVKVTSIRHIGEALISLISIGSIVLSPLLAAWLNLRLTRREAQVRAEKSKSGTVFQIKPFLRGVSLLLAFLIISLDCFLLIASYNSARSGLAPNTGPIITLLFMPILLFLLYLLYSNSGMVILTAEAVILRRLGRERRLAYQEIESVHEPCIATVLTIKGAKRRICIPRLIDQRPQLYRMLLERTPAAPKGAEFPVNLSISILTQCVYVVATVLFIAIYLGIGLIGLWMPLAQGNLLPLNREGWLGILIPFALVSALFVPALIFIVQSFLGERGAFGLVRPIEIILQRDEIRYRTPSSPWKQQALSDLRSITIKTLHSSVRVSYSGAVVREQIKQYMLQLNFADDQNWIIDEERARQFGYSAEGLTALLQQLYPQITLHYED